MYAVQVENNGQRAFALLDPPTPSVAPAGKVRRMRPSPFNKASGVPELDDESESNEENEEVAPRVAARPARKAAVAAIKYTVDLVSSDEEAESDEDDEFELDSD